MSLRARMGLCAGAAVAIAVVAVAVSAYAGTRSELQSQLDNSLEHLAQPIVGRAGPQTLPQSLGGERERRLPAEAVPGLQDCDRGLGIDLRGAPGLGAAAGLRQFVSANGHVCRAASGPQLPLDARARSVAAAGRGRYFADLELSGHELRELVTGVRGKGALQVALPSGDVEHTLSRQVLLLALIAAGGIALAALLGVLVARTALAPIARFTRQTESIASGGEWIEHERVDVVGNDELARLARTFNATLDDLERAVQAQRNLVADASHELRTPIASLRANLQLMRDEARLAPADREALRADMVEELDELTALVSDVVELARGMKPGAELGDVRVDAIVAASIVRTRRRRPGLTIEAKLAPTLVKGEGERISRAVSNLLENAAKWSPSGGVIEVALEQGTLTVRDHGPGFEQEDLPYVFDRFHRARKARSKPGSGLGLAIVRQAAEAHGGFVEASNAPGGGALLRVGFGPQVELEEQAPEPVSAS